MTLELHCFNILEPGAMYIPYVWIDENSWLYGQDEMAASAIVFWGAVRNKEGQRQKQLHAGFRAIIRTVNPLISDEELKHFGWAIRNLDAEAIKKARADVERFLCIYEKMRTTAT